MKVVREGNIMKAVLQRPYSQGLVPIASGLVFAMVAVLPSSRSREPVMIVMLDADTVWKHGSKSRFPHQSSQLWHPANYLLSIWLGTRVEE